MPDPPLTLRELRQIPLARLKGVGASVEQRLHAMGLESVLDLLQHYPRRYHDRTKRVAIADLAVGQEATVVGEVRRIDGRRTRNGRALVEAVVSDGTSNLTCTFFNQGWRERQLPVGTEVSVFGKVDLYRGRRQVTNPVVDVLSRPGGEVGGTADAKTGRIVPVYPQSEKADVFTWQLRGFVAEALRRCAPRGLAEPLPGWVLEEQGLVGRDAAYRGIHLPDTIEEAMAARRRLIFDEFLRMQVGLVARKRHLEAERKGIRHVVEGPLVPVFHANLPFELTGDQRSGIADIAHDMASPAPMHRLLQGDVGSGKTVVALSALLMAVQGGHQGALMAPTEVLAEQHYLSSRLLLEGLVVPAEGSLLPDRPVGVALLTNRTSAKEREEIGKGLAEGRVDILVGTHALLYDAAAFTRLGLAVIDEQHRFGVEQRAMLRGKGDDPDVLVMTATPIPRTAAMLVYGDLDRSELREMPPGRTPITTGVVGPNPLEREAAYSHLRDEVAAGRQAYLICPLVEGSAKTEAKAVTKEYERLQREELAGLRLGLLHGQMASRDKEAVMTEFRAARLDVLVATTVVEVGIDVPNATVMIVEDADRFGLSQLHQLRGRIGRGGGDSYCYLFADPSTDEGRERLNAMAESNDGFFLAEKDLELRGAGEVFGDRQSGLSDLKLGRIPRDEVVVVEARGVAERLLDDDGGMDRLGQLREEVEDLLGEAVESLFKS